MNAAKYGLDRVYFGGCFIRGKSNHAVKIGTDKQATLQPSRPYLTLSASGPKGLCVLISYAMRDSCEYLMDHLDVC
jgi:hypothetical protein